MAMCHECGSQDAISAVICRECRRNITDELRLESERSGGSRDVTMCAHYDPFRSSPCGWCWFAPESGIPIEQMPGNTLRSRCARLVWNPRGGEPSAVDNLRLVMGKSEK